MQFKKNQNELATLLMDFQITHRAGSPLAHLKTSKTIQMGPTVLFLLLLCASEIIFYGHSHLLSQVLCQYSLVIVSSHSKWKTAWSAFSFRAYLCVETDTVRPLHSSSTRLIFSHFLILIFSMQFCGWISHFSEARAPFLAVPSALHYVFQHSFHCDAVAFCNVHDSNIGDKMFL